MLGEDKLSKELLKDYLLKELKEILANRVEDDRSYFVNPDNISNKDVIVDSNTYLKNEIKKLVNEKINYFTAIIGEINYIVNNKNLGRENTEESTHTRFNLMEISFEFNFEVPGEITHEIIDKLISIKKDLLKIVYGLIVISDDVSSNVLSLEKDKQPYLREFIDRCDNLLLEIIERKKSVPFLLKFRAFLKQSNPLTVVGLGLKDKFYNMSIYSKLCGLSIVTSSGVMVSSILLPVSFVTVIPLILCVTAIFVGNTFSIAFRTYFNRYFGKKMSSEQDSTSVIQSVKRSFHKKVRSICSSQDISSMTLSYPFMDDSWKYVTDVETFLNHVIISCNINAEEIFTNMINETIKGLEDVKEQKNIKKKVSKLFSETRLLINGQETSNGTIRDDISKKIRNFIKEFHEIIKNNTIIESSTLKIFVDNSESFFRELMNRVEQSSSSDRRVSTELDNVVVHSHEHMSAINL